MNMQAREINQHIIDAFLQGDKAAFSTIYEGLKGEIFLFSYKILRSRVEAEDVSATVFEKLWTFRPNITSPTHLKNWLFITARNRCINTLRDTQATYPITEQMSETSDPGTAALEREQVWTSVIEKLWETMRKLPPVRRKVMHLRFQENKSVDEIAEMLGLRPQTVRNHIARGKNQVHELLSGGPFKDSDLLIIVALMSLPGLQ